MLVLPCVAILAGCGDTDIAENHVAVLSVTRWDDYKRELQPTFSLTADQALTSAIPDTLQLEQGLTHQFQAALALQLAPSSALPAGFLAGQSGAPSTQPSPPTTQPTTQPATTQPSVIGSEPLGSDAFLQYQAATALYQEVKLLNRYVEDAAIPSNDRAYIVRVQISTLPKKRNLHYDEFLDLGLFFDRFEQPTQAVSGANFAQASAQFHLDRQNLWNLVLTPATTPTSPTTRTQEAPAPPDPTLVAAAHLADELAKIEAAYRADSPSQPLGALRTAIPALQSIIDQASSLDTIQATKVQFDAQRMLDVLNNTLEVISPHTTTPIIIPLLVTDEIESAMASRQADDLEQLAFSLSAAYAGIGGNVNLTNLDAAMRNAVGRDYNSLLSVARLNDNTIRVRIGARQTSAMPSNAKTAAEAAESYELNTQTHYISFLVLVPTSEVESSTQWAYFGTHASFVDISDGHKIERSEPKRADVEKTLIAKYSDEYTQLGGEGSPLDIPPDLGDILYRAASAAQNSRYDLFLDYLNAQTGLLDVGVVNRLWMEMTEERATSDFDSGNFELPAYPDLRPVLDNQTVFLLDDGKGTTATITGSLGTTDSRKVTVVWIGLKKPPEDGKPVGDDLGKVVAGKVGFETGSLSAAFPSLKDTKIDAKNSKIEIDVNGGAVFTGDVFYVLTTPAAAPSKGLLGTFTVSPPELLTQSAPSIGSAVITLTYSKEYTAFLATADPVKDITQFPLLTLTGQATVTLPLQVPLVADPKIPNAFRIIQKTSGPFTVPLSNLVANKTTTFGIAGPKDWQSPKKVDRNTAPYQANH
jgi:hypothetical protein